MDSSQCDMFIKDDPYESILFHLSELRPFSKATQDFVERGIEISQRGMRQAFRKFFPEIQSYITGTDEDGSSIMIPETDEMRAEREARQDAEAKLLALRAKQYDAHRELIRQVCQRKGSIREILSLAEDGLPLQTTIRGITTQTVKSGESRPPQPPGPGKGLVYEWSELLGEYLLVRE